MLPIRRGITPTGRRRVAALRADAERLAAADLLADATNAGQRAARRLARRRRPPAGLRQPLGVDTRALPQGQPVHPARQWERGARDQQRRLLFRQSLLRRFERPARVHAEEIGGQSRRRDHEAASATLLRREREFPRTRVSSRCEFHSALLCSSLWSNDGQGN